MPNAPLEIRLVVDNPRRGGRWGLAARAAGAALLSLAALGAAGVFTLYVHYAADLPRLDAFDEMSASGVTRFEAADGSLAGEWFEERRLGVTWGQLPERLVLAFLAAEDARFFEHSGIDLRGIARAMLANLRSGDVKEGASTITQQLAKTLVGSARSYARKVKEAILARRMEDVYSKKQILTWYLNVIYLGHGSYGVQAAAQNYFRKNVWELSLAEMAMVAGLAQSPGRVTPILNRPASLKRMAHVLGNMRELGWISAEDEAAALAEPLVTYPLRDTLGDHVPHYTEAVRQEIVARYDSPERPWLGRSLTVSMAVEPGLQRAAELAVRSTLEDLAKKQGYPGPLARLPRAEFFQRNAPYSNPRPGDRILARVAEVTKTEARVEVSESLAGVLTLKATSWAAPYSDFPVDAHGRRQHKGRVSFGGKLKAMNDAFAEGDIVLVELVPPPPPKPAPKDKGGRGKGGKGKGKGGKGKTKDTPEAAPAEAPPAPEPPSFALVPVPLMEASLLSFGLETGGLDVMVGGWDFDKSEVNRAVALRQTGSTIKPLVYAKAYDLGLPTSALFSGAPYRAGAYNPTGARSEDDMMVWDALVDSVNSVSLRVLQYVLHHTTLEDYQAWGRALGLERQLTGLPSEVLGTDQTAVSMAQAFGVLARRGLAPRLHRVRKVVAPDGAVLERHISPLDPSARFGETVIALWEEAERPPERRIAEATAWLISRNLVAAVAGGTGKRARKLGREVAGKTGTLAYDVWFDGYTADRVAVAWVGADRRERTLGPSEKDNKVYGGDTALPIWLAFMVAAEAGRPARPVGGPMPEGVVDVRVDPVTGLLLDEGGRVIPHRADTAPTEHAPLPTDPANIGTLETEF